MRERFFCVVYQTSVRVSKSDNVRLSCLVCSYSAHRFILIMKEEESKENIAEGQDVKDAKDPQLDSEKALIDEIKRASTTASELLDRGEYKEAKTQLHTMLGLINQRRDGTGKIWDLANTYHNLSRCEHELRNQPETLHYCGLALATGVFEDDDRRACLLWHRKACALEELGENARALYSFKVVIRKMGINHHWFTHLFWRAAVLCLYFERFREALEYFRSAKLWYLALDKEADASECDLMIERCVGKIGAVDVVIV
jgi:tetratricopeptide (TPR) repeat protein